MPLTLNDIITVTPRVSKFDNVPLEEKLKSIEVPQNLYVKVRVSFVDSSGTGLDLSGINNLSAPVMRLAEITLLDKNMIFTVNGSFVDLSKGLVEFVFDSSVTKNVGLYYADFFTKDDQDRPVLFNRVFISIIPSLIDINQSSPLMLGPITSKELFLSIKNSSPNESTLLQQIEFDLSEIIHAMRWPVEFWNTSVPDIGIYYTTANFPYKYQWVEATIGELLAIAAHRYRRDRLPAQVGGIALDEIEQKAQLYEQAAIMRKQMYMRFVRSRKAFIDTHSGFGSRMGVGLK
jgi:hypothetical protein